MPAVEDALRENEASDSFRGEEAAADDAAATVECVYTLTPHPPEEGGGEGGSSRAGEGGGANEFWRGLQPTGISWSASGQGPTIQDFGV
jgi:hypothetical protein